MNTDKYPYVNHMNILYDPLRLIDVPLLVKKCTDQWYNQTLCQVNDSVVRLGILQGEYHWHKHSSEDELFYVLKGRMVIQLQDQPDIVLSAGEMAVVPKGVEHCPKAEEPSYILVFEPYALVSGGD